MHDSLSRKVDEIFGVVAAGRANALRGGVVAHTARAALARALEKETDFTADQAYGIAFNLLDWNSDAAFLVAVLLYPERFTDEELADGVIRLMVHVPNHIAEAARIGGFDATDVDEGGNAI